MKKILFLILIILLLYLYKKKFSGGGGLNNMPDGPEKDIALKKQKDIQNKFINNSNSVKIKPPSNQNAFQRRLTQLIKQNGRGFLTFLFLQRKYMPNSFESPITKNIVWMPLDDDENYHIRTPFNSLNPTDPFGVWIPNRQELERLTDMMFSHSLPLPPLFILDFTIIQLEIYAKWFKKYYVDMDYSKQDNFIVKGIKNFIKSL